MREILDVLYDCIQFNSGYSNLGFIMKQQNVKMKINDFILQKKMRKYEFFGKQQTPTAYVSKYKVHVIKNKITLKEMLEP